MSTNILAASTVRANVGCPLSRATSRMAQRQRLDLRLYRSIDDVDRQTWDALVGADNLMLRHGTLSCLERSGEPSRYAVFTEGSEAVGVAAFQLAKFESVGLESDATQVGCLRSSVAKRIFSLSTGLDLKLVVCGSTFHAGENGYAFASHVDPKRAVDSLARAVDRLLEGSRGTQRPAGALFKEFYGGAAPVAGLLEGHAYCALEAGPAMVLPIDPEWRGSYEAYLASLTSKYRVKANRAYAKSERIRTIELSPELFSQNKARLDDLYAGVRARADYRLGQIDLATLGALRAELGDELVLRGYVLDDTLVGFMSAFEVGDSLEAHLVGFEYDLNQDHAIYSRMLYDYLKIALERGLRSVNYGRTANEIKSTVGATPVDTTCYVRHRRPTLNRVLPWAVKTVQPPSFPLRRPFKKTWYERNVEAVGGQSGHFPTRV